MASNMFIVFKDKGKIINAGEVVTDNASKSLSTGIQVLSWSHSFNQPTSATRSSAGSGTVEQANHSDFSFTKYLDASTDDLLKVCWSGKQMDTATFAAYRSDGSNDAIKYLEVIMTHVLVSNLSIGGGTGDLPTETVTLSYATVSYNYIQQKSADGTGGGVQKVSHDLNKQVVA